MIKVEDLVSGKEYWYGSIIFSNKTSRVNKRDKPQLVIFDGSNTYSLPNRIGIIRYKNGMHLRSVYDYETEIDYLFETEEECIDYYNSILYNEIDKVQSDYDRKIKLIKSNLIKRGR